MPNLIHKRGRFGSVSVKCSPWSVVYTEYFLNNIMVSSFKYLRNNLIIRELHLYYKFVFEDLLHKKSTEWSLLLERTFFF